MKILPSFVNKPIFKYWNTTKDINQNFLKAQYAVRGIVPQTAAKIQAEIQKGVKHPFESITELNIGNPQIYGQIPISFNRQVAASLLDSTRPVSRDVERRASFYRKAMNVPIGAYSESPGYAGIRSAVADYIQRRDQTSTRPSIDQINLIDGASQGITMMFNILLKNQNEGVMIPIPQYPLYSAVIDQCGAHQIPYFLDEQSGWSISRSELEKQYDSAVSNGIKPKILVCINPGNPTGQVLEKESIVEMIKFASQKKLTIFADEVYQENIYNPKKQFISFRKVQEELNLDSEIYSFHSISKGINGECGLRGGYMEISTKVDPELLFQIQKTKTIMLCSNTVGQIMTGLMITPPTKEEGCSDETVQTYQQECKALFEGLKRRAAIVTDLLNKTKGVSCQPIEGAMYAFPSLQFSKKFIEQAKKNNQAPDLYYCLELLKETGLAVVPGSGFHQYPGTHHFRTTILIQPEELLLEKMQVFKKWHEQFMAKF